MNKGEVTGSYEKKEDLSKNFNPFMKKVLEIIINHLLGSVAAISSGKD